MLVVSSSTAAAIEAVDSLCVLVLPATCSTVAANVEKVAQMTEETSAAGHTLRDAAEGLNQLAASLRATVGRFQL